MYKKTILILLFILLIPSTFAAQEYLTTGVSRDSSYRQDGTGLWTDRLGTVYTRVGNFSDYVAPLVWDIDNDGINEIIVMQGSTLEILNFTGGTSNPLRLEASVDIGAIDYNGTNFRQVPGLIDYDSDNITEIVVYNRTHMITYKHSGSAISLNQSQTTGVTVTSSGVKPSQYPVIKCLTAGETIGGAVKCTFVTARGTAGISAISYDLTNNTVGLSGQLGLPSSISSAPPVNTHIADYDGDGYPEMLWADWDVTNDHYRIYVTEFFANNSPTFTYFFNHNYANTNHEFTDIIVNNLDGSTGDGLEITYGFTTDTTDWDFTTVDKTATEIENNYCGVGCSEPEGSQASLNLFELFNTGYGISQNDVCYYVANNVSEEDTLYCASMVGGSDNTQTTITNDQFDYNPSWFFVHEAKIYGDDGLLLPTWGVKDSTLQQTPDLRTYDTTFVIPVDFQKTGSLDLIGSSPIALIYYDDGYVNQNMDITNVRASNTPLCQGYSFNYIVTIEDNETDPGRCYAQEEYANRTLIETITNDSITGGATTWSFYYNADSPGSFNVVFYCKDDFHTTYNSVLEPISVSNDTNTCIRPNSALTHDTAYATSAETASTNQLVSGINDVLESTGNNTTTAKSILFLIIFAFIVGGIVLQASRSGVKGSSLVMLGGFVGIVVMLIGYKIGWVTILPLLVVALLSVALITMSLFGRTSSGAE